MKKDELILVDKNDEIIGYEEKEKCHNGAGKLHRAFSIFIFNSSGEMLLQKRAANKRLWPSYWTNACCSHPRRGESYEVAAHRRLTEELGLDTALEPVHKFSYQARFGNAGSENEMDQVFVGVYDGKLLPDKKEISECKFLGIKELKADVEKRPEKYTPWFKICLGKVLEYAERKKLK